jgi:hypothetical protein
MRVVTRHIIGDTMRWIQRPRPCLRETVTLMRVRNTSRRARVNPDDP